MSWTKNVLSFDASTADRKTIGSQERNEREGAALNQGRETVGLMF
jgi:hypothetical protein